MNARGRESGGDGLAHGTRGGGRGFLSYSHCKFKVSLGNRTCTCIVYEFQGLSENTADKMATYDMHPSFCTQRTLMVMRGKETESACCQASDPAHDLAPDMASDLASDLASHPSQEAEAEEAPSGEQAPSVL